MHAAVCFSRAVSDCEIFVSYDLFGAELNLFAPLSCSVSLGPEDKHIRACTPSHSWPGLDIRLISATSLSFLAPAVREERKWEQTSIWLRGCGWIEWKCGKQLNIGICLYFSCADEGKKWPSCFNTFHYFRFVVEHFWLHHSDWLIEIETRHGILCKSKLLSFMTVTKGRTFSILSVAWFMGQWQYRFTIWVYVGLVLE